ncbi:unnamed protein product [Arabis nemorensis]|uniref:Uncharacterized protein n=1 Tax=Arabis nemorensis TaxID=586526 RepID=A0A565BRC2_9BRAS|nr:unnamed protein product [Arabis nemorensis]
MSLMRTIVSSSPRFSTLQATSFPMRYQVELEKDRYLEKFKVGILDFFSVHVDEKEGVLQPHESPEPQKVMKSGKYNLRVSLSWDNAFFTSSGVLEPEELSCMMESNHKSGMKSLLPLKKILIDRQNLSLHFKVTALWRTVRSLMKPKASPKKPSIRAQGLRKAAKQPFAIRGTLVRGHITRFTGCSKERVLDHTGLTTRRPVGAAVGFVDKEAAKTFTFLESGVTDSRSGQALRQSAS